MAVIGDLIKTLIKFGGRSICRRLLSPKTYEQATARFHSFNTRRHVTCKIASARRQIRNSTELNLVIGAADTSFDGWVATDIDFLDVRRRDHWDQFVEPESICRLLAEHVFEHLSLADCRVAFANCYEMLDSGGRFRIAVPDGNRTDDVYLKEVTPPKDGHLCLFTIESLTRLLEEARFTVHPLEYFDADGQFHAYPWKERDGIVTRSARYDRRQKFKHDGVFYTSLILDAVKS